MHRTRAIVVGPGRVQRLLVAAGRTGQHPVLFFGPSYSRASIRALLLTRAPAAALPSIPRSNADSERGKAALIARRLLDGKFGKNKVEVSLHGPCCCTMCPLLHPAVTPGQLQVGQSVSQHGLPKVLIAPAHRASYNTPPAALSPAAADHTARPVHARTHP